MQVSAKTHNACLAVLELALREGAEQPVPLKEIALSQSVSHQFMVQILLQLKRAGLVESTRGSCGGYRLAKPSSSIRLLDVVVAVEGPLPTRVSSTRQNPVAAAIENTWTRLARRQEESLAEITFDELVEAARRKQAPMYYI